MWSFCLCPALTSATISMRATCKIITTLVSVIVIAMTLTGCSFFCDFFVVNTTNHEVTTVIKFQRPIEDYLKDSFSIQLRYADNILSVNNKTKSKLNSHLNYKQMDRSTISFSIPAKSTVLLGGSYNRPPAADSIKFTRDKMPIAYSLDEIYKQSKKTGALFPPFHVTYTLE